MIRYLSLAEVIELHRRLVERSGSAHGIRAPDMLDAALAQPQMTFSGVDLYETLPEKAAALCFSIVMNHPFIDGNKRVGHAAMEVFLVRNGLCLEADVDEQEQLIFSLAAGRVSREDLTAWVANHAKPYIR